MLDVAVRGGALVDGTGSPARPADIGIAGGRVVEIGEVGQAHRVIDADGLVVAPGFCDIHTHFDAQVFWDPALTPSSLHGVTTAIGGNCGFTLAPLTDDAGDYLVRMLAVVEGMPLDALRAGVPLDWASTASYLDQLEGTLAINAGFMVGHSALRRVVMGADATRREATAHEVAAMGALLRDGLEAGGIGFSSSWGVAHNDGDGVPVPSRHASAAEILALAGVCRGVEGTSLEFLPAGTDRFRNGHGQVLVDMAVAAQRPVNWNVMRVTHDTLAACEEQLAIADEARAGGGDVIALTMPIPSRARFSFHTGFVLDVLPGWGPIMTMPVKERLTALRDPAVRRRLAEGAAGTAGGLAEIAQWDRRVITETFTPETRHYQGRLVADIAREEGKEPFDALLDIVCADDLQTTFARQMSYPSVEDWRAMVSVWRGGRAVIGASDAGAHLDFTAYFDYPVYIIEHAVREHGVMALEEAVALMTDTPARLYGLRDRGRLCQDAWADVVVFDPATLASGPMSTRFDLPAGAGRLYGEPVGVHHVLVNGEVVVTEGSLTGTRPGRLLRSGRDTRTPERR